MKQEAQAILSSAGIAIGQDFDTLSPDQLGSVLAEAEAMHQRKYGKPPADSAAFARKRYGLLQQRASA